jgi:hypothetical protein
MEVVFHRGCLPMRLSSIEVVFHFFKIFKIYLYSTRADLAGFAHFQLVHYLSGGGWGGWGRAENKAKLSPAGAGSWAELGKNKCLLLDNQSDPITMHVLHVNLHCVILYNYVIKKITCRL